MNTISRVFGIFVLLALLAACGSAPAASAPTSVPMEMPAEMIMEPTPTATATIDPTAMPAGADAFKVSAAQYFLDSAGFHGMATTLSETQTIDPTYLSTVTRVNKVLAQTSWPSELNEQAQAFTESLGKYAAALEADNIADAVELSETVHDAQHELSHSIDHWMEETQITTADADPFNISVAQCLLDLAGFHGIATALSETQTIDPTYLSTVNRVNKVLAQTTWPTELNSEAQTFTKSLGEFAAALEADDIAGAVELSETVHDAQHELSHSIDHWMENVQAPVADTDPFDISVAQYFLDSAGFHGMATTLSETKTIDPTYLSKANRVYKVLMHTTWSSELNEEAQAFVTSLDTFDAALEADNVADAIELSETVHDAQHEFSHSIDHWMEGNAQN